jgi:two-component system, NarL family, sensor histidine kinase NreB
VLPFNTFTIHELVGFIVSASLAVAFYLIYARTGRRLMDLLCANFIACAAGLCLVAFLTDNLVPAGQSSRGWPNGPTAAELAETTLRIQRFAWLFAILIVPAQLHFVLCYCDSRNFLRRHIRMVYIVAVLVLPLLWTPLWLTVRSEPAAETSSWYVTIPWMPEPTLVAGILVTIVWCTSNLYSFLLLYWRRQSLRQSGPPQYSMLVLVALFTQMAFGMADLLFAVFDFNGIAVAPIGATAMGVILAAVLLQERAEADRSRQQLSREKSVLLESLHQPLLYFDKGLHIQWANTHASQLAGVGTGPLVGLEAHRIWKGHEDAETLLLQEAARSGQSNQCELAASDGVKWVIYNVPVLDDLSQSLGILVLAVDVTQIRWAEDVLRTFSSRMLATREEERRRLASDLHDSVAQSLSALLFAVTAEIASPDTEAGPVPILDRMASRLRESVQEIRRVCYDLYPPALEHFGLPPAVERVVDQCTDTGVDCRFDCDEETAALRFGRDIEIALFRIVQEAIGNAVKHGHPDQVHVTLKYRGNELRLSVVDDGLGFDPADVSRYGLGLSGMKERARGIGGSVTITSRRGHTRVDVRVPCKVERLPELPESTRT